MTTATLSFSRVQRNLQSKIDSIDFPVINWKFVCLFGFFVVLLLSIFYVWQINELTEGFYLVNTYEKQINILSEKNKELQVSFAENSFLGQAIEKIRALNFQKVVSIKYIPVPDNLLATVK